PSSINTHPRPSLLPRNTKSSDNVTLIIDSADLAEVAALIVDHRLADFAHGVHHKRSIAGDRLIERNTADEEQLGSALGCHRHLVTVAAEDDHVVLTRHAIAERGLPADDEGKGVVRRWYRLCETGAGGEAHVEVHDRRPRVDRGARAERFARDHGDLDFA